MIKPHEIDPIAFGQLIADVRWLRGTTQDILDRLNVNDANCDARCKDCSAEFDTRLLQLEKTAVVNASRIKMLMAGSWAGASGFVVMLVLIVGYFLRRRIENGS